MKRVIIGLCIVVLLLGMLACKGGGGGGGGSVDPTLTYAAEQFEQWKQANETPEP